MKADRVGGEIPPLLIVCFVAMQAAARFWCLRPIHGVAVEPRVSVR